MARGVRGFTLLETLVAFAILSVSLTLFYQTLTGAVLKQTEIGFESKALLLAQSKLAAVGTEVLLKAGNTTGVVDDRYVWRLEIQREASAESGLLLYSVTSEVSWNAQNPAKKVALTTLLIGPEEPGNE